MGDIELRRLGGGSRNIPYRRLGGRGRAGVRASAVQDILTYGAPVVAGALASSGFLRNFVNANPAFAGYHIRNTLRMARRRFIRTRTLLRKRRRGRGGRSWKARGRGRRRYNKTRYQYLSRFSQEYDGSSAASPGYINCFGREGGVWKFVPKFDQIVDPINEFGDSYTHMKILKVKCTYVPETKCCPTLDETATNENRSIPACFKSYHIGVEIPKNVKSLLGSQGAIAFDPQHVQHFSFIPKYVRRTSTYGGLTKPVADWINIDKRGDVKPVNGPIIAWSPYKLPGDAHGTQCFRFKWIVKFYYKLAKFRSFVNPVVQNEYVTPETVYHSGKTSYSLTATTPKRGVFDKKEQPFEKVKKYG